MSGWEKRVFDRLLGASVRLAQRDGRSEHQPVVAADSTGLEARHISGVTVPRIVEIF